MVDKKKKNKKNVPKYGLNRFMHDLYKENPNTLDDTEQNKKALNETMDNLSGFPKAQMAILEKSGFTLEDRHVAQIYMGLETYRKGSNVMLSPEVKFLLHKASLDQGYSIIDYPSVINAILTSAIPMVTKWNALDGVTQRMSGELGEEDRETLEYHLTEVGQKDSIFASNDAPLPENDGDKEDEEEESLEDIGDEQGEGEESDAPTPPENQFSLPPTIEGGNVSNKKLG